MREQLLAPMSEAQGPSQRLRRRLGPLRGGSELEGAVACAGFCGAALFLIFAFCVSTLGPNEYGITRSYLSGRIGYEVERGGIHVMGPFSGFVKYPATQVTLKWSRDSIDHPPVSTRTGADPNDPDSGGQPISITCAVQFQFIPSTLRDVYFAFASFEAARQRFLLLAGNMVSNTAQEFTPQAFWKDRALIAQEMLRQINATLWSQGVVARRFEMMKVDFAGSFEDSITQVQVAEQQRVVNEYEQQVQQVVQSIEVMRADNEALIANISAGAQADSKELRAGATRDAFHLKQGMKARKYSELQHKLGFTPKQMQEYFKIKSVQGQGASGKVIVGLPKIGESVSSVKRS
uniref:Band 7 domain-containing protein n=1 Tax=Alexandrium monilatum TaxID=311494 RepID=A0A7S4SA73_9DINO